MTGGVIPLCLSFVRESRETSVPCESDYYGGMEASTLSPAVHRPEGVPLAHGGPPGTATGQEGTSAHQQRTPRVPSVDQMASIVS